MKAFYAETRLWSDAVEIGIGERGIANNGDVGRGTVTHQGELVFKPFTPGDLTDPTMRLTPSEARALMDALWGAGVRPSSGEGNTGQLGATQKHLEDMRALVFKTPSQGTGNG